MSVQQPVRSRLASFSRHRWAMAGCIGVLVAATMLPPIITTAAAFRAVLAAAGIVLIFRLWRTYVALGAMLGGSADEVHAAIARIGRAEGAGAVAAGGPASSVLAGLVEMQGRLDALNRELEQRVADRTAQLEASNRELEAFSYSVSHDLRAPLRAIDGYGRILREDHEHRLDAEGRRLLGVISAETHRMGELIDDLLTFSRLGRQSVTASAVDMRALAQSVFHEHAALAPGRVLELELLALPPARGDQAMLRVVFSNLIANAIKFTQPRLTARIEIGYRVEAAATTYYVTDNGVGFDMTYADKLFGVFQRLHTTEEFEGTGVGLALVQRIIQRHGGRVWADAKPDTGAAFYFTLPAAKGADDERTRS